MSDKGKLEILILAWKKSVDDAHKPKELFDIFTHLRLQDSMLLALYEALTLGDVRITRSVTDYEAPDNPFIPG